MNRSEALHLLGLEEGATEAEIKAAYKESAQIMHPDRFADNKKLQARATEQFKAINEARDLLLSGKASNSFNAGSYSQSSTQNSTSQDLHYRLNAINQARANVIAQIDQIQDTRGLSIAMIVIGGIGFILKSPFIKAIAGMILVYGVGKLITDLMEIKKLEQLLVQYDRQKADIEKALGK